MLTLNKTTPDSAAVQQVSISGKLTTQSVMLILDLGKEILSRHRSVCFSLKSISHSDSAGLALLIEWLRYARTVGTELSFTELSEPLLSMIRVMGLGAIFSING